MGRRCGTGKHSLLKLQPALEVGEVVGAQQLARLVAPVEERLPHGSREALEPSLAHRLLELDAREGAQRIRICRVAELAVECCRHRLGKRHRAQEGGHA